VPLALPPLNLLTISCEIVYAHTAIAAHCLSKVSPAGLLLADDCLGDDIGGLQTPTGKKL
jgi:hypothetical protein